MHDYEDDDFSDYDYDDDKYLRRVVAAHHELSGNLGDESKYCGFSDYSKFEDVLNAIEDSVLDGTAYLGKKSKKHKKKR